MGDRGEEREIKGRDKGEPKEEKEVGRGAREKLCSLKKLLA